jgi:hypothetical protein
MEAARRFTDRVRPFRPAAQVSPLLLLRSTIGLLMLVVLAAGAATPGPLVVPGDAQQEAAMAKPGGRNPGTRASAAPTRRQRSVFVCDDAGTPVYSDRPCGPDLLSRSISIEDRGAGRVASTVPPAPLASTRPRARNMDRKDVARQAAARCEPLRRQLDDLDDRMRAGYSSREAAKLWDRRRGLKDALRETGC